MAVTAKKAAPKKDIEIIAVKQGSMHVWVKGMTPFYCNRVAEKAKRELLMPRGKMTAAQKAVNLKHDPIAEFRSSPYINRGPGETRIQMVASSIKKAMASAALDMPTGVNKSQIGRLVWTPEDYIPMWGIPLLAMDIVRSADMNKTPDVRTRAKLVKWATRIEVRYAKPMLTERKVITLFGASGILAGIGDWRQQKGGGSNGMYEMVSEDDPELLEIIRTGGREAQDEAFANPVTADEQAQDLLEWYLAERERRGSDPDAYAPDEEDDETAEIPAHLLNGGGTEAVI